jgi:hypothetical protein
MTICPSAVPVPNLKMSCIRVVEKFGCFCTFLLAFIIDIDSTS